MRISLKSLFVKPALKAVYDQILKELDEIDGEDVEAFKVALRAKLKVWLKQ